MGGRGGNSHGAASSGAGRFSGALSFLQRAYGMVHAQAILGIIQNAPAHIQELWEEFGSSFRASRMDRNSREAYYAPDTDSVHLGIDQVARGDMIHPPYATIFHEYGHMTDYLIARQLGKDMSDFEQAMEDYEAHFDETYPYAIGIGYPGKTPEENIRIIRDCIRKDEPVVFNPEYRDGCDY